MPITTFTSRYLNQNVSRAKQATQKGPVFITDRGKLAHVLLSFDEYQRLTKQHHNIVSAIAMSKSDIEFEPPRLSISPQVVDLD